MAAWWPSDFAAVSASECLCLREGVCEIECKVNGLHCVGSPFTVDGGAMRDRGRRQSTAQRLSDFNDSFKKTSNATHGTNAPPFDPTAVKRSAAADAAESDRPKNAGSVYDETLNRECFDDNGFFRGRTSGLSTKVCDDHLWWSLYSPSECRSSAARVPLECRVDGRLMWPTECRLLAA